MPQRIVCLSAEAAEILADIGAWPLVVGVTVYFAQRPELAPVPVISAFSSANLPKIAALSPDLVITISDVQASLAADLIRLGLPVLALNNHTLADIADTIRLLGRVCDRGDSGNRSADEFLQNLHQLSVRALHPPRVYFEEWPDPLIHGARWITEAIALAGGQDIFPISSSTKAESRVRLPQEIVAADPEVIFASWCGKPADFEEMRSRPGWDQISAVKNNLLFEIPGADILQTGPGILRGLRQMREILLPLANRNRLPVSCADD